MNTRQVRPFTGRHMAAIMIGFFAVVIAVNVTMARMAIGTFGGVVVENSYVASQHFNRWLDEAASESALGWKADFARGADGRVMLALVGPTGTPAQVTAVARHPLGRQPDRALQFGPAGPGRYVSQEALPAGRWRLRLEVRGVREQHGKPWRSEGDVR
jgi:nitrogen fixation protein FixH